MNRYKIEITENLEDKCYRALQAGKAPNAIVIEDRIYPAVVRDCMGLFLLNPYRPEVEETRARIPRMSDFCFRPNLAQWQLDMEIPNFRAWITAAVDIVKSHPVLSQRIHYSAIILEHHCKGFLDDFGIGGDPWFLAAFDEVYQDDELHDLCNRIVESATAQKPLN
jgi:hypothetical protein